MHARLFGLPANIGIYLEDYRESSDENEGGLHVGAYTTFILDNYGTDFLFISTDKIYFKVTLQHANNMIS
jgi:hypothetical protein